MTVTRDMQTKRAEKPVAGRQTPYTTSSFLMRPWKESEGGHFWKKKQAAGE